MIRITRSAAPEFLSNPKGIWVKETTRAITYYSKPYKKAFSFKAYQDERLKNELKKIFVKCAYCETPYGASSDGDVEHFRPKGKVSDKNPPTPGYYWLANDWNNLFLSCQHCNQKRRHIIYGELKRISQGKLDQFPLKDEVHRVFSHSNDISNEESARLLVNPCLDNPIDHFDYEESEGVIIAKTQMGEKSIEIYALQRINLVQARKKRLILLFTQIQRVKDLIVKMNTINTPEIEAELLKEWSFLQSFTGFQEEYAGMCRFFVQRFLKENGFRN